MKVKKRLYIVISFIVIFLTNCSKSSETLSEFNGGKVTFQELSTYYDMNYLRENPNALSVKVQSQILDEISLGKIISIENNKEKIISDAKINKILDVLTLQILFNQYREEVQKKSKEKVQLATSSYILYLSNGNGKSILADSFLSELNKKDTDFKKFIQKNTEEVERKSVSGRIEPVCLNCGSDPFIDIVKAASKQKGKFIKIQKDHGIYLINVMEVASVEKDKLEDIYKKVLSEMKHNAQEYIQSNQNDKNDFKKGDNGQKKDYYATLNLDILVNQISNHFRKMFEGHLWNNYLSKLIDDNQIIFTDLANIKSEDINDEMVLIQQKSKSVSFKDIRSNYNILKDLMDSNQPNLNENMEKEMILRYAQTSYFPNYIIKDLKEVLELKNTEKYKQMKEILKYSIIKPVFVAKKFISSSKVSEQELLDTYEAGKNFAYSKTSSSDPSKKVPKPFEDVKEEIRRDILKNKTKMQVEAYISKLKKDYDLKIYSEKLKDGKI